MAKSQTTDTGVADPLVPATLDQPTLSESQFNFLVTLAKRNMPRYFQALQQDEMQEDAKTIIAKYGVSADRFAQVLFDMVRGVPSDMRRRPTSKTTGYQAKTSLPPKYRHPDNPDLTWAGRGRMPLWIKGLMDDGVPLSDLRISPA